MDIKTEKSPIKAEKEKESESQKMKEKSEEKVIFYFN